MHDPSTAAAPDSERAASSERSSWTHLGILAGATVAFALVWALLLLAWFHPENLDWRHLELLPRALQDAYTNGLYAFVPVALVGFWKGLERRPWSDLGLRFRGGHLLEGLVGGTICIVFTYGVAIRLGWTEYRAPATWPWRDTGLDALAAVAMGLVEEFLFRGLVLRSLLRDHGPRQAILASAGLFAILHMLRPGSSPYDLVTSFVGLFVTGWLLGQAAWARSLWLSLGLHAPWIFFIGLSSQHDLWWYDPAAALWTGLGYPPRGLLTIAAMGVAGVWFSSSPGGPRVRPRQTDGGDPHPDRPARSP